MHLDQRQTGDSQTALTRCNAKGTEASKPNIEPSERNIKSELEKLVDEYNKRVERIGNKFALSGKPSLISRLLASHICDLFVLHKFKQNGKTIEKFDIYFKEKHSYAKRKLIERLKRELACHEYQIVSEARSASGRYDVLLEVNRSNIEVKTSNVRIVIEVKAGIDISLEQLERYLRENTAVILCRIRLGQTVLLRAKDHTELLVESLKDYIEKADRILDGKLVLVPGPDCSRCDAQCTYAQPLKEEGHELIRLCDEDFSKDIESFLKNLYTCIDATVNLVVKQLKQEALEN